ncbi:transmembrane protein 255B [Betta splendens]|uniref:Transmembrane protein 255B n=1 Tax=Betta splendens TaxID=158456 RepID=A0A6P7M1G4_BETSP|nr:transmembrane protein 255B [Betta splendens]
MQQPESQRTTRATATEVHPPEAQFVRRRRTALGVTGFLLALALVVLAVGLSSSTRTDNVAVAGYYPGIILSFGAFLGVVGIHLDENRKPMLVAAIIFISLGVIASFFCAIIDGIIATEFIDIRPLKENMCDYYSSGSGYYLDSYYNEVKCQSNNDACDLKVRSNTCYCCYLYNCERSEETKYYMFTGVSSCWDVVHLYRLLWASVVLNVIGLFMGIITAAILGAYKDMLKMAPQRAPSPAPPPHIMYNPTQHMLSYTGLCPPGQALPAYPNYLIPTQHTSSFPASATPQLLPEGGPASGTCLSEENQQPSLAPIPPQPLGVTQEPGGYMLTPNAPVLYGAAYNPFEKPPPYAC